MKKKGFAEESSRKELLKQSRNGAAWFSLLFICGFITTLFNISLGLTLILSSFPCLIQAKYLAIIAYLKKLHDDENGMVKK